MTDELHERAIEIRSDIDDFSDSFDVSQISDEEELLEYSRDIESLKKDFRRIHAQLKDKDNDNFDARYPDYENVLASLSTGFKTAKEKLRKLKRDRKLNPDTALKVTRNEGRTFGYETAPM